MRLLNYITILYFSIAILLQLLLGNFTVSFFAFPLNVLLALGWFVLLYFIRFNKYIKPLGSIRAAIYAICALLLFSFVIGFFPNLEFSGDNISGSSILVFIIIYLVSNLWLVVLRRLKWRDLPFLLNHLGLIIALVSFMLSATESKKYRAILQVGMPIKTYSLNGYEVKSPIDMELLSFDTKYYSNNSPMEYHARILIGDKEQSIRVNHPVSYNGYDIYLVSPGDNTCVIEMQNEPWKYGIAFGIIVMLIGAGFNFMGRKKL